MEAGDTLEPEPRVKPYRSVIGRVDAADHHVFSQRERGREERFDQRPPDALAAHVVAHVDGVFDRVAISRPRAAPLAERGKTENLLAVDRHEHGKSLRLPRGKPR